MWKYCGNTQSITTQISPFRVFNVQVVLHHIDFLQKMTLSWYFYITYVKYAKVW